MNKEEQEFLYDFETSYEAVRKEKGFTHKQMAEEMKITTRYLRYLRSGQRKGVKGKGKITQSIVKKEYQQRFKLVHFLIMVYYDSIDAYRFFHKQRRVNIIELKSGKHDIVFHFAKGKVNSVAYTTKKSEIPDLIYGIMEDYGVISSKGMLIKSQRGTIINYDEMVGTALNIREENRFIDLI